MAFGDEDEARAEEWQVLHSIYPDFVPSERPKDDDTLLLHIPVELSEPLPVHFVSKENSETLPTAPLSHLPSIVLSLNFPSTYPFKQPPIINGIQPVSEWLPPPFVEHLLHILLGMWKNECILSAWVEHIHDGDQLLSSLDLLHSSPKSIRLLYTSSLPHSSPHLLSPLLVAHNLAVLESRFKEAIHFCPICRDRFFGIHCISLTPCSHVACRSCLREFWGGCIKTGDVAGVVCPDPECVKEAKPPSINDVGAIVSPEEVERWRWLLRKQEAERDPTITHCPLASCQQPVRAPSPSPTEDDQPSEWDRLRTCDCGFAFCVYCRRAWHGPHTSCSTFTAEFIESYLQYPEGSPERKILEQRHGRNNVLKFVAQHEEEQANRKWMNDQTMACPGCRIRVQKIMGCNHMTCPKCRHHFCYRCGSRLNPATPYAHFNTPGEPCYFKLFDQLESQDVAHMADF